MKDRATWRYRASLGNRIPHVRMPYGWMANAPGYSSRASAGKAVDRSGRQDAATTVAVCTSTDGMSTMIGT
jgi:hypothetical protein